MIFAALTSCPVVTLIPLSCNVPAHGKVLIFTQLNALVGVSFASPNQKFAVVNVYCVSSFVVTNVSLPVGASLREVIFIVMVFGL